MGVLEGAGTDADDGGAGVEGTRGVEEAGAEVEASSPRAHALRVPGKVIMGSSRFQQFFFMYAKLMVGLKESNVNESKTTPRAMHKVVISAGKLSLEELD